jgi:uncharacterized protein
LGYAYENGKGVEKNIKKALEFYEKSADEGSYDHMANYAMVVIENGLTKLYPKAYKYLNKCYSQDEDLCKYAIAMYVVYLGRTKT